MGYYIETGEPRNKAKWLKDNYGAQPTNQHTARDFVEDGSLGVVCVVHNGLFEAAANCHSIKEYDAFTDPRDNRFKEWLVMNREDLNRLSGKK